MPSIESIAQFSHKFANLHVYAEVSRRAWHQALAIGERIFPQKDLKKTLVCDTKLTGVRRITRGCL